MPEAPTSSIAPRLSVAWASWGLSSGVYTPFFGAWLAFRGLAPAEIGAVLSAGMALRVIVPPIAGIVADARGDRRSMMLWLFVVQIAGYLALCRFLSPLAIFLLAVMANTASNAASPLLESVSMRLAQRFGFDYGHVKLWNSITFAGANVLSGLAISRWGFVVLAPWMTVALTLSFAAIWRLPAPPRAHARGQFGIKLRATLAEARELLGSAAFLLMLLAASFDQGSHAFYYGYGGLNWTRLGYGGALIGAIWPLGVIAEALLFGISLKLFRAAGATRLLLLGAIGCVLRWTMLAFDPPLAVVIVAQILHGASFALAHLGAMYFIAQAVPPRLAATAQSLYAVGANGIAMGLGTYASGLLYASQGGRTYLLMAAMGAAATLFAIVLGRVWHGGRVTQGEDGDAIDHV